MPNFIKDRDDAIMLARQIVSEPFVVLDTETTGVNEPQAVSIALVNDSGDVWESLVKSEKPVEPGALSLHGISNEMVANSPTLKELEGDIYRFIRCQSPIVIYNARFDMGVVKRGIPDFAFGRVYDAMTIYSAYNGNWDDYHGNYRWVKLGDALSKCGLTPNGKLHGAAVDAYMTRELLIYVSKQELSTENKEVGSNITS